jgi:hypothetical protein
LPFSKLVFNSGGPFWGRSGFNAKTPVVGLWMLWAPRLPLFK